MIVDELVQLDGNLYIFRGTIKKLSGRVLRLQEFMTGKVRLICEDWWLANGGESVEEVLETSDEKDAGG